MKRLIEAPIVVMNYKKLQRYFTLTVRETKGFRTAWNKKVLIEIYQSPHLFI